MKILPHLAALPAILVISGLSAAQDPAVENTPGAGLVAVDLAKAASPTHSPTPGTALQTPQPAECLCDCAGQPAYRAGGRLR
jgi:hypothetical protein